PCVARWIAKEISDSTTSVQAMDDFTYHPEAPWPYGDTGNAPGGGGNGNGVSVGNGEVRFPVDNPDSVTSAFGMRFHPVWKECRMHTGVDYGVAAGYTLRAIADGKVIASGWSGGYGNTVQTEHVLD